jgi:hypothetical protein
MPDFDVAESNITEAGPADVKPEHADHVAAPVSGPWTFG